jgi:hypothetical protein
LPERVFTQTSLAVVAGAVFVSWTTGAEGLGPNVFLVRFDPIGGYLALSGLEVQLAGAGNSGRGAPGHRSVEPDRTNTAHLALPLLFGTERTGNADRWARTGIPLVVPYFPKWSTRAPSPTRAGRLTRGSCNAGRAASRVGVLPGFSQRRQSQSEMKCPIARQTAQWPLACGNDNRWRPGGLRSLAAAGAPKSAPFHGADGADALQQNGSGRDLACHT